MHDPEGKHGAPSVGLLDDHVDVGELGEVGPLGRPVVANYGVDLRLGSVSSSSSVCVIDRRTNWRCDVFSPFLDLRVFRHGLDDGQNQRRGSIRAALHECPSKKGELVLVELICFLLVEHTVHERVLDDIGVPSSIHAVKDLGIKCRHEVSHFHRSASPVAHYSLRNQLEERK